MEKNTWMSKSQREDYDEVCEIIDKVKTPKQFYGACEILNSGKYDGDVVALARQNKNFLNTAQYSAQA